MTPWPALLPISYRPYLPAEVGGADEVVTQVAIGVRRGERRITFPLHSGHSQRTPNSIPSGERPRRVADHELVDHLTARLNTRALVRHRCVRSAQEIPERIQRRLQIGRA